MFDTLQRLRCLIEQLIDRELPRQKLLRRRNVDRELQRGAVRLHTVGRHVELAGGRGLAARLAGFF